MSKPILISALLLISSMARAQNVAPTAPQTPPKTACQPFAETVGQHDARMKWFRDARFGMFIHWGLYAQAGGVWNGKKTDVNNCAEWLMNGGKVPSADYAAMAKDFNPVNYDADAWVRAARDAGMKYIVLTAKHHEGFAMFRTKASPFNIVDATPFKRDPLQELAAACRKYGVKLGLYYSQNLDWHHPGGGGGDWDPTHRGDPGKYVDEIAIPQIREILTNYGDISVLWFDIPGGTIDKERADRIMTMVKAINPNILVNNRLGGGYEGDIATPEQFVPPMGFPGRDWETCMTMNKTWGYSKLDHDWKSSQTLIRTLADSASKGGNLLLNVGPNELGEIPAPSLERLAEIGRWTKVNGEAIYNTRASVFPQLPAWGRVTARLNTDGTSSLYAIVFDAPTDGVLTFPGLTNTVRSARILGSQSSVKTALVDGSPVVQLSPEQLKDHDFVVALMLNGAPRVDTAVHAQTSGTFALTPRQATLTGGLTLQLDIPHGLNSGREENLGYWTNKAGAAAWQIRNKTGGDFTLHARIAAPEASVGSVIEFVSGDQVLPLAVKSTGGWNQFVRVEIGTLHLSPGLSTLSVRVKTLAGEAPCNLGLIELVPVK